MKMSQDDKNGGEESHGGVGPCLYWMKVFYLLIKWAQLHRPQTTWMCPNITAIM